MLYPSILIEEDRTLGIIRAFTNSQIEKLPIEDRILQVHKTELRRPVMYLWSAHDFVLGLRDAIIGASVHLVFLDYEIICENNIVLGCHPEDTRGCIMDLDMAIPYKPQSSSQTLDWQIILAEIKLEHKRKKAPMSSQTSGPFQADRTGTTPYMSVEVLLGRGHTHFDDMESFFYVLLSFFLSYDGPMSKENLLQAHERGFTLQFGCPAHIRTWPPEFQWWTIESMKKSADYRMALFHSKRWGEYLRQVAQLFSSRWGHKDLRRNILHLITNCWALFGIQNGRAKVPHEQFIGVLNEWLEKYEQPPQGCNNCPFNSAVGGRAKYEIAHNVAFFHDEHQE
ncbi:hypothetical protein PAXINDRAFT_17570 [Paxillus involutus ATCC 200175]|uniref:Fungal-type protein kinase domain-containing protein n=1 Tax=Paxillus involutus ATCC 200175 TaxID=664439 RepID=A0A0C9TQ88_PAXIN|nr:hypothetical protein PAXINDRAFT_17570 [Paxillus involutus ATCC 200175]